MVIFGSGNGFLTKSGGPTKKRPKLCLGGAFLGQLFFQVIFSGREQKLRIDEQHWNLIQTLPTLLRAEQTAPTRDTGAPDQLSNVSEVSEPASENELATPSQALSGARRATMTSLQSLQSEPSILAAGIPSFFLFLEN